MPSYYSSWVTNGTNTVPNGEAYRTRLDLTFKTGTSSENYTDVTWSLHLENKNASFLYYWSIGHVTINGQKVWDYPRTDTDSSTSKPGSVLLQSRAKTNKATGTLRVPHSNDGTKTISYSTSFETINKTNSPAPKYAMTSSGTVDLPTIPRYTSITSFTRTGTDRGAFTFSWSAANTVSEVQSSVDGGSWVSKGNPGGYMGSIWVGGLKAGTQYSVKIRVKRADSGLWTTSSTLTVTTAHNSTLSSYSAAAVNGSSTAISIAFATSSTGSSSATVTAKIGSGSYRTVTSGYQFTGLTANTSYTITYKVKNNSSGYENTYERTTKTHPYPNLNVSVAMVSGSKESYTINFSSVTNANRRYYKIGSAAWAHTTSSSLTRSIAPGNSITIQARAYHTDTQVYGATKSVTITAPAKNAVTSLSVSGVARNRFTVHVNTSQNTTQVKLTANGKPYTVKSEQGSASRFFSQEITDLNSGTKYTVSATPYDSGISSGEGTPLSQDFTTTVFQHPGQATATKLTFHSAKVYLSFPHSVYMTIDGEEIEKTSYSETVEGLTPDSIASFSINYRDKYSSASGTRAAYVRLDDQDTIGSVTMKSDLEAAVENEVILTMNTKKWTSVEYTLFYRSGSSWLPLSSGSTTTAEKKITLEEHHVEKILKANITSRQMPLKIKTQSKDGSILASVAKEQEFAAIASENNLPDPSINAPVYNNYEPTNDPKDSIAMSVLATNLNTMTIGVKANAYDLEDEAKNSGSYIQKIDVIIGGTNEYGANGIATNIYTYSGTQDREISKSHTTKTFTNRDLPGNYVVVEVTDSRSITKWAHVGFEKVEYSPPTLVTSASRADYFGDYLIFRNTRVTLTPSTGNFSNTLESVKVTTDNAFTSNLYLDVDPANPSIYSANKLNYNHPNGSYDPGSIYRVEVKAIDFYRKEATVSIVIPSGRTPLFIDQERFQVGIGTSNPMALLDVDGEFVANNIIFFDESKIEDN